MEITAIIIARNEEKRIKACLDSVKFCSEIIVVDNGSTDKTFEIAKKFGAKVFKYETPAEKSSFAEIRNLAISKAKSEWILFVDADEIISSALAKEIELRIKNNELGISAYAIPRRNILLGQEMKHGGWWPDYVLRLIKKEKFKGYEGKVHEQPKIDGEIGKLKNHFIHTTHESLTEMINKTNKWSEIEAKLMFDAGHPPMNLIRFFTAAFREFWYRAVVKLGFLDGPVGIIEIMYQTFSRFISYAKLWEMQNKIAK